MTLQVVGAGLPRTGTSSLRRALEQLLGGPCLHMSALPGHPFELGADWDAAIAGGAVDYGRLVEGYVAAVDWPASMVWRELHAANPDALVLLSTRGSAHEWWESMDATVLAVARTAAAPGWNEGRTLLDLLERFTGTERWDDPSTLMAAYERHHDEVRAAVPPGRLLEWRAPEGWAPICSALGLPQPPDPFPHRNRREHWG